MGTGPLHVPKLPGIPGIEDFEGHSFHTSRWDYDVHRRRPVRCADGRSWPTSASASSAPAPPPCSASRPLARRVPKLYVFQRTPSSVDVRDNRPTDPEWFADDRDARLAAALARELHRATRPAASPTRTSCMDGWTDSRRRDPRQDHGAAAGGVHAREDDGRRSRTPTSRRWRRSAPASTRSSRTPRPRRS